MLIFSKTHENGQWDHLSFDTEKLTHLFNHTFDVCQRSQSYHSG